ncbi:MAG: hypothetical protein WDN23_18270 [Edaphobacter sp.]
MSVLYDPIAELQKLGYTEREAAFLYLVGMHCGYFLRRQFLHFLRREDGAMVQRFLVKSMEREHIHAIEYAHGRHIYHLRSKTIYRILDQENSQNRRTKADTEIKARLMQLDYLLDHFGEPFLETAERKVQFFHDKLSIPIELLPRIVYRGASIADTQTRYFADRFPISVQAAMGNAPLVRLVYIDAGLRSIASFARWLEERTAFLRALKRAEIVYTADTAHNFAAGEQEFLRRFPALPFTQSVSIRGYLLQHDYPVWSMKYRRAVL